MINKWLPVFLGALFLCVFIGCDDEATPESDTEPEQKEPEPQEITINGDAFFFGDEASWRRVEEEAAKYPDRGRELSAEATERLVLELAMEIQIKRLREVTHAVVLSESSYEFFKDDTGVIYEVRFLDGASEGETGWVKEEFVVGVSD
jgi:hypothetical protein